MDDLIQEEQAKLDETIADIQKVIQELNQPNHSAKDDAESYQEGARIEKLQKYSSVIHTPYFGRLDVDENGITETLYFGKTGIAKSATEPLVLDWRVPIYSVFTTFSGAQKQVEYEGPLGTNEVNVHKKRHIQISDRRVVTVDEIGTSTPEDKKSASTNQHTSGDDYLVKTLTRKNEKHEVKEIIETLQPEQDRIMRLGISNNVLVQGAAGSGKSSIALHRISYLLFRYNDTLKPENILVLAPNKMFLSYMKNVAPHLEIENIQQDTFADLAVRLLNRKFVIIEPYTKLAKIINGEGSLEQIELVSRFKGSIQWKNLLEKYIQQILLQQQCRQPLYINEQSKLSAEDINDFLVGKQHLPINKQISQVVSFIGNWAKEQEITYVKYIHNQFENICHQWVYTLPEEHSLRKSLYDSLEKARDYRIQAAREEFKSKTKQFISQWKLLDAVALYKNALTKDLLELLDPTLEEELVHQLANSKIDYAKFSDYEDLAPLLYLELYLNGVATSYDYVMIDEAQDLNPFQIFILKQITKSMTILGDISQSIFSFAGMKDWDELFPEVFEMDGINYIKTQHSYRSTAQIMSVANQILSNSPLSLPKIVPVNRSGETPKIEMVSDARDLYIKIANSLKSFSEKGYQKIAIISKEMKQAESLYNFLSKAGLNSVQLITDSNSPLTNKLTIIPSYLVKGLEFDAVILPNANAERFGLTDIDTRLLFVCVTRANHELHVYYHKELTPLLRGNPMHHSETSSEYEGIL